jgi:hypothetical protein
MATAGLESFTNGGMDYWAQSFRLDSARRCPPAGFRLLSLDQEARVAGELEVHAVLRRN